MKNKLFLVVILLSCLYETMNAQRTLIDTVRYRFHYDTKEVVDEGKKPFSDEINVDIGDKVTYCYSRWDEDNDLLYDSIMAKGGNVNDFLAAEGPISMFDERVIKNYPSKGNLSVTCLLGDDVIYNEPMVKKTWNLELGDTTIVGYNCKKATCNFRGRKWTAWYTLDIPISEGPWKIDGLPGMILKAVDSLNQFSFECFQIKTDLNIPMTVKVAKCIKTTALKVHKLKMLRESNYTAYSKLVGDDKGVIMGYVPKSKVACLLEKY